MGRKAKCTDEMIIAALLECGTVKAAAAKLDISERTIHNRKKIN